MNIPSPSPSPSSSTTATPTADCVHTYHDDCKLHQSLHAKLRANRLLINSCQLDKDKLLKTLESVKILNKRKKRYHDIQINLQNHLKKELLHKKRLLEALRWHLAIQLYKMVPIKTYYSGENRLLKSNSTKAVSSISTILGFPMMNVGTTDGIPVEISKSSLIHICHFIDALTTVLNIQLIHPIDVFKGENCIISHGGNGGICLPVDFNDAKTDSVSLSLLRVNVIGLCVQSGINPKQLWPSQCILLNLHLLYQHCQVKCNESIQVISDVSDHVSPDGSIVYSQQNVFYRYIHNHFYFQQVVSDTDCEGQHEWEVVNDRSAYNK